MIWVIILTVLVVFGASGVFLGGTLAAAGMTLLGFFVGGGGNLGLAFESVWSTFNNFTFSSIILFVLLGDLFFASGLSSKSYSALAPLFHRIPGRLLHTNVAVCMLFGAVSGTSSATAAAVGSAAFPELERRKYHRGAVVGSLAASGTLGLLIPPSLALILYGAMTDNSIARLFLGGVIPGVGLGLAFMVFIMFKALVNPSLIPEETEKPGLSEVLSSLLGIWPLVLLMFSVLGPLYMGIATPTESAAFGFVLVVLLGLFFGDLTFANLLPAIMTTMVKFGAIAFVVVGAVILKNAVALLGLPKELIILVSESGFDRFVVFGFVVAIFVLLGCLFDGISLLLLTVPFIAPMLTDMGFDAIWLGVMITILIEIGMVTPPVGPNLFILSAITNNQVSVGQAALETLPYWIILLVGIALFTVFPEFVLWLPNQVYG